MHDRVGKAEPGVTDIPKSPSHEAPAKSVTPAPQLASLKSDETGSLPSDVVFSVEEPASATEVALAEKLTTTSVKGPMPPEALGAEDLRVAAAKGNPIAQYMIGIRYIDGRGVTADPKMGSQWMERAARSGLAPAQYRLGTMYERGVGVTADIDTARSWYLAAAERGNIKAMHNLAVSVSGGGGSTPNYALATKWYGEAALRGLADSQFNLGILAEHGLGQTKNLAEAYKWYVLAAKQGDAEARKRRDIVSAQLSPKTIVSIDGKVATWKPKAISPEANSVTEPNSWGDEATSSAQSQASQESTLVSRAQTLLNKLGYDVGVPDGLAGEKTRAGVKRFQERNGLDQNGQITIPLVTQLEALAS
jgi:localization factor PodJL